MGEQTVVTSRRDAVMAEIAKATSRLRETLEHERDALERRDSEALNVLTENKNTLLQQLESLDAERRKLDGGMNPSDSSSLWQEIRRQLEACRHINDINGSIVEHQLLDVRRALGILRGTGEAPPVLYGPGGQTNEYTVHKPLSKV